MKLNIKLERPIVFFDLETTGLKVATDRIVSISAIKLMPDGKKECKSAIVNPEMPIPKEASDVHGITDEMVVNKPVFSKIAKSLHAFFEGCDIAGFNSNSFDNILLFEEFNRVNLMFPNPDVRSIDVRNIFVKMEERNLTAAYKFYCQKSLEDAHNSDADIKATAEVFLAQIDKYEDLQGKSVSEIADFCSMDSRIDLAGKIAKNKDGVPVFNFGMHKDKPVKEVIEKNPSYYDWFMGGDFSSNTKAVLKQIVKEDAPF